jgi:hypothetical protein
VSENLAELKKQMLEGLNTVEEQDEPDELETFVERPEEDEPAAVQVEDADDSEETATVDAEQADSGADQALKRDNPKGFIPIREYRKTARQLSGAEKTRLKLEQENQALKEKLAYAEKRGLVVPEPPTEINYAAIGEGDPDAMREAIELQQKRLDALNQPSVANYVIDPEAYSEQEHAFFNVVDQAPADHPIHQIAEWIDGAKQRGKTPANDTYAKLAQAAITIEQQLLADPHFAGLDDVSRTAEVVKRAKASLQSQTTNQSRQTKAIEPQPAATQVAPNKPNTPRSLSAQAGVVGAGLAAKNSQLNNFLGLKPEEMVSQMRGMNGKSRDQLWDEVGLD